MFARALLAVMFVMVTSCGLNKRGESCDITNYSRECEPGTVCSYNYQECPEYGCPKCRKQCTTNADCAGGDTSCAEPICDFANQEATRGVCRECKPACNYYEDPRCLLPSELGGITTQ
ncbi:MAG: hypothetical protein AB2A00_21845 [Myxococcota bacterium]